MDDFDELRDNKSQLEYLQNENAIGHSHKSSSDTTMSEVFRQADNLMYSEKPEKRQAFQKLYRTLKK